LAHKAVVRRLRGNSQSLGYQQKYLVHYPDNMKILDVAKIGFYLSLTVLLGFSSYFVWSATQEVQRLGEQTSAVLAQTSTSLERTDAAITQTSNTVSASANHIDSSLSKISSGIDQSLYLVNRPCVPGPCGLMADSAKTLNTARMAIGQVEIAANHEDKNLKNLDTQETQLFQDTHSVLVSIVPVENEADKSFADFDALLTSPDVTNTTHNFGVITGNFGTMTTDASNKFHLFLYPPPCREFKCHVLQGYTAVKDLSSLAEPAYWINQILTGAKP
jgi:hypothetical protein